MTETERQPVTIKEVDIEFSQDPELSIQKLEELIRSEFEIKHIDQKDAGVQRWLVDKHK